ncbi:hypothetical protein NE237_029989 [Protea cynaroides]|uniref:Uncharacterized protein n=1 Tax=Protea cynaroides TaxID=273540 RepID=A0A9Q0GWB2_9MAGN|nr:hypothetical protein NE237_029989 [Protea cynaroides]
MKFWVALSVKMAMEGISRVPEDLVADARQGFPKEEAQDTVKMTNKVEKRFSRPRWKVRDMRRQQRSFSKHLSLETRLSSHSKESEETKECRRTLERTGQSFGGFDLGNRVGGEAKKADFNSFRTKSTLGKQKSLLPLQENEALGGLEDVSYGRYFAALTGPELDQLKDDEDILLPKDEKWPFLLRFPIGCFGICLGLSSQAILWQALATSPATSFLHIPRFVNFLFWLLSLTVFVFLSFTYALKCLFYFEAVRREYDHPVRVNFFFAPWIVCMFLALGVPHVFSPQHHLHPAVWCVFMAPVFILDLKIYGQWLSGGNRRLSKVANPSTHLSVVGNFVGSILASKVGWHEAAKFFWAVGLAHYLVVFVTLYQRLPTNEALPKELHPVYSMFIATPAAASIAWESIYGEFDGISRTCYFIGLFLYASLVARISLFSGFRFSLAWWSYTFPMTTASVATIKYAEQVPGVTSNVLAVALSFISSTTVSVLLVSTLLHGFVWHSLFPNDLPIAIQNNT